MKIIAIRGKNLASLAGEFDIPFQQEPLLSAGLFAISGATGAGKSTLLDALCLALYDDTPRLLKASSTGLPDVAGETVTSQDSRTLLRRGSAEGYAEVDFVGNDGREYRSRWSVRRSRSKAQGKLQSIEMSLKSLPDLQAIGGNNKGDVKAEIVQRIGLNFKQFTRSVLLAQNEFSTFLKADDNERGELLETLTGIVIYTTISKRAFEREKLEKATLARLNDRLADHKPLSHEDRAQLDQDSKQADELLTVLELRKQQLDSHLRWHQALNTASQNEQRAEQELEQLSIAHQAAAPRRLQFARIEAVQGARSLLEDCARIEDEMARSQLAIVNSEAELELASSSLQTAIAAEQAFQLEWQAAEQRLIAAAAELDQAKALDTQFETLQPHHQQAVQSRNEARAAESVAQQALQHHEQQRTLAQQALNKADDWLKQHLHLEKLDYHWPRWDTLLQQATQHAQEQAQHRVKLSDAEKNAARLVKAEVTARNLLDAAVEAVSQAESKRAEFQQQLDKFDINTRLARKNFAEHRRELLISAEQQWRDLSYSLSEQVRLTAESQQLQVAIEQADAALGLLQQRIPVADAELAQAEKLLRQAEASCAGSVESLRASLEENQPCPVCGSLEHPYHNVDRRLHTVLDGLQTEVSSSRERLSQLQQKQTTNNTRAADSRRRMDEIQPQLLSLEPDIQKFQSTWECNSLSDEIGCIENTDRPSWFAEQQRNVRAQLQVIAGEEKTERAASMDRDKAQAEYDRTIKQYANLKDALTAAQAEFQKAHAVHHGCDHNLADSSQRLNATLDELDGAFDSRDWLEVWRKAPQAFHAGRQSEVEQWKQHSKTRDDSQLKLVKLEDAHRMFAEELVKASALTVRAETTFAASSANIESIQNARCTLFGGKAITQIQAEFTAAITSARKKLDQQIALTQQCAHTQTRHQEARDQARQRLSDQQQAAEKYTTTLTEWVDQFNGDNSDTAIDTEQLRVLLAHTVVWINAERKQLQDLDSTLQQAATVVQERRGQRESLEQNRPTPDDADTVNKALSSLEEERQTAQSEAARLQLEIAKDRERRERSSSMLGEIEKQEATYRLWAQLSELIGSADGKKFRNYAQQFTLDVLLGYANQHLGDLSRRYRLQRITDTLALLVIDQDMGDELRSVHSLSGGESFLVSLALALGLASLSSNRVRVESLFIDEGFGSLDPETLSVAMDALDGLQAMGRKVGVISHVQEMTERISTRILVQKMSGGKSQVVIA